ncbi:MAG TPA: T9SS type A sorting domain-containing protein, partial [Ferruginibacter sp.]|nr:T9SS type A sorting domain-containing protein [Ferruginibacter sp.]
EVNNMNIINTMQQSATRATNPDNRVGYGIPDMKKAFVLLIKQLFTKQSPVVAGCGVSLEWNVKTDSVISVVVERKLPADLNYTTVSTQTSTGAFLARNFIFSDDLGTFPASGVKYRFKMNIAADTSFYLDSVTVNFTPKPALGIDKAITICGTGSADLTTQFNTTGLTSSWSIGGNPVTTPTAVTVAGNYQLIAINNSGCADTASVNLSFIQKLDLGADKTITKCLDSSTNLTTLYVAAGLTTSWTIGGNPVTTPTAVTAAGVYRLIANNTSGCADTAFVTITNDPQLCVTSLLEKIKISPNPVTDRLKVEIIRIAAVKVEMIIHNSAGQIVYSNIVQQPAGGNAYFVPMKAMASGVYYVTVRINDKKEVVKKIIR